MQGRHAQDMSLITPENVHQRPQWRVTPLGRLIRPMRMRPARPLDPPLDPLRTKNVDKGKGKVSKTKKKRLRAPPTRARKQTIDPLRWGSTHLSGIFLEDNGNPPPPRRSGSDGSAKGESTEVEEVEHILEASDQTPPGDDKTPPHADGTELDLAAERASALDLLSAMFGEANDWGGAESIDSDVEMAGADAVIPPHPASGPLESTAIGVAPTSQAEEKGTVLDKQTEAAPPPATTGLAQPSTQKKLKDLFAPREEEGELLTMHGAVSSQVSLASFTGFSLIGNLDLDSELDLDMELNLNEPTFPSAAVPAPGTTSRLSGLSTSAPTMQHNALDSSLPFFFPQKGPVPRVRFARTADEAEIRERWEAARGELTREWKRRHREAVKSRRRRGGDVG